MKARIFLVVVLAVVAFVVAASASELVVKNLSSPSSGVTVVWAGIVTDDDGEHSISTYVPPLGSSSIRFRGAFSADGWFVLINVAGDATVLEGYGTQVYNDGETAELVIGAESYNGVYFAESSNRYGGYISELSLADQIALFFAGAAFIAPILAIMLVIRYAKKGATVTTD